MANTLLPAAHDRAASIDSRAREAGKRLSPMRVLRNSEPGESVLARPARLRGGAADEAPLAAVLNDFHVATQLPILWSPGPAPETGRWICGPPTPVCCEMDRQGW